MKTLPLYPSCRLHRLVTSPGPLLLVYDSVNDREDKLASYIQGKWGEKVYPVHVDNVPFIQVEKFNRVLMLGRRCSKAVLGRDVNSHDVRGAVCWYGTEKTFIPCYPLHTVEDYRTNKFYQKQLLEDIDLALGTPAEQQMPPLRETYKLCENKRDCKAAAKKFREAEWIAFDYETAGIMYGEWFIITDLAVCTNDFKTYVFDRQTIEDPECLEIIKDVITDKSILKTAQIAKYECGASRSAWGIEVGGLVSDTQLKRKLCYSNVSASLSTMSELVGMGGFKQEFGEHLKEAKLRIKEGREGTLRTVRGTVLSKAVQHKDENANKFAYALTPAEVRARYCARDAYATARLEHLISRELKTLEGPCRIWQEVVSKATTAIEQIEAWGVEVDQEAMKKFSAAVSIQANKIKTEKLAPMGLERPNSTQDVSNFLFNTLKLKPTGKTKNNAPSTDAKALAKLKDKHAIVPPLIEYRQLNKLSSSYGEGLIKFIRPDGRIHPSFNIVGARTGRMSSSEPNAQNIPNEEKSEWAKAIKDCFVAAPGKVLVSADYSQIELRVLGMLAGDEVMRAAFESGIDFHRATAAEAFELLPDAVTAGDRRKAKAVAFGSIFGKTEFGLSQDLGISRREAKDLLNRILSMWPKFRAWEKSIKDEVLRTGLVHMWWAGGRSRRRPIWEAGYTGPDEWKIASALRKAVNAVIQGTANEFCLASGIELVNIIKRDNLPAKVVLLVHDDIVSEVDADFVPEYARLKMKVLGQWDSQGFPIEAKLKVGKRWGSMRSL